MLAGKNIFKKKIKFQNNCASYSTINPTFGKLFALNSNQNNYQTFRENEDKFSFQDSKKINSISIDPNELLRRNNSQENSIYKMDLDDNHVTPSYSQSTFQLDEYIFSVHEIYNATAKAYFDSQDTFDSRKKQFTQDDLLKYIASSLRFCKQKIDASPNLEQIELKEISLLLDFIIMKSSENPHLSLMVFKTILEFLPSRNFQFSDKFMMTLLNTIAKKWTISTSYVLSMIMDAFLNRSKLLSRDMYSFLIMFMGEYPIECSRSGHELLSIHGLLFHLENVNQNESIFNQELLISILDILSKQKDESVFQIFDQIALEKKQIIGNQSFEKIIDITIHYYQFYGEKKEFYLQKMIQYIHLMESRGFRIVDEYLLRQVLKLNEFINKQDTIHIFLRHSSKSELTKLLKYISKVPPNTENNIEINIVKYIKEELLSTENKLKETLLSKLRSPDLLKRDKGIHSKEANMIRNQNLNQNIKNNHQNTSNQENKPDRRIVLEEQQTINLLREGRFKRIYYDSNNIMYRGESRQFVVNRENQAVMSYMIDVSEKINQHYNVEESHLVFDVHEEYEGKLPQNIFLWKARPVFKTADDMLVDMASKLPFSIRKSTLFVTADIALQQRLLEKGVFVSIPTPFTHPETHIDKAPSAETTNLTRLMKI